MKSRSLLRSVAGLVPAALLTLILLPGCEDQYSENRVFPVRTDPVVLNDEELPKLLPERPDPDPPGQLPIHRLKDLQDARNPLHVIYQNETSRKQFEDNTFNPKALTAEQRSELEKALQEVFGTPAHPKFDTQKANIPDPLAQKYVKTLRLEESTLKAGANLYRQHCMQCHGLTGDGRGPTARWVNPHPRDYRPGMFKFQSTNQAADYRKPRREDLFRTLYQGIEGTTMPAHNVLPDEQLEAMVSYVIMLSIRGQAELNALKQVAAKKTNFVDYVLGRNKVGGPRARNIKNITKDWYDSQDEQVIIKPVAYSEPKEPEARKQWLEDSVRRGHDLFLANCGTCHKDYGRQAEYKLDSAGWLTLVRPANLTTGIFRGGRRPLDLYWRIHSGINGSGMAKQGAPGGPLTGEQIWDVVNFLQVLPYPMRKDYGLRVN